MALPGRNSLVAAGFSVEGETVKYAELHRAAQGRFRIGKWGVRRFGAQLQEQVLSSPAGDSLTAGSPVEGGVDGAAEDASELLRPLAQSWTAGALRMLRRSPVFASLADGDVLTKFITLPELTQQEVARMVELRLREYLPMPQAEMVWDFSMIRFSMNPVQESEPEQGAKAGPGEGELRVMVMGVERGTYMAYRESIAAGGVILRSLEGNPAALTRGCNFLLGPDHSLTYALLYLSDTYSLIIFVVEGGLYYSRQLEHGLLALTPDEAGKRRAERLLREIYRSVDFFSVESRGVRVDTLYLSNGGSQPDPALTRRIQQFMSERLEVDVRTLHEVHQSRELIQLPPGTFASTLLLPIGLALRAAGEVGI